MTDTRTPHEKNLDRTLYGDGFFPPVRVTVLGIQGSGKTYLVKNAILEMEPERHLVFDPNDEYSGFTRYVPRFSGDKDALRREFALVSKKMIRPHLRTIEEVDAGKNLRKEEKRLKLLVIDEADLIAPARAPLSSALADLYVKSRHYRLTIVALSRRLTDLSTYILDVSDNIIIFKTVGYNALRTARAIRTGLEDEIKALSFEKHEFIFLNRERESKKFTLETFDVGLIGT